MNSIYGNKSICKICGVQKATDWHHMVNGNKFMRKHCEEYGLVIPLCRNCHNRIHKDQSLDVEYKRIAEERFLRSHTMEEWMKFFHKNYL